MGLYHSNILYSSSHYTLLPPVTAALLGTPLLGFPPDSHLWARFLALSEAGTA